MSLWRWPALAAATLALTVWADTASAQRWRLGPDHYSPSHPTNDTIHVFDTGPTLPTLRFFATSDLAGAPVAVLDAGGLWVDGARVCRWVGDRERFLHALVNGPNGMALPCVAGIPIDTVAGFGSAQLRIVVRSVRGRVAEVHGQRRRVFFDLTTLPGNAASGYVPEGVHLPPQGTPGWRWTEPQTLVDRREGHALATRLREPAFAHFYHGVRRCLLRDATDCLADYLDADFTYTDPATDVPVPRSRFVRHARQALSNEFSSRLEEVAWCLLRGRFGAEGRTVYFLRKYLQCTAVERDGSYRLTECAFTE